MDPALLLGPHGGSMALSFGFGAAAGYGFAIKSVLKTANERIEELKHELERANERIQALEDQRFEIAREDKA